MTARTNPCHREQLARLALALTARAFGDPRPLGDVRWLLHARFHLDPAPMGADPWLREPIARFLAIRPVEQSEGARLYPIFADLLDGADEFAWQTAITAGTSRWDRYWTRLPGKALEQRIEELLDELETSPDQDPDRRRIRPSARGVQLAGPRPGEGYILPPDEVPEPASPATLPDRAPEADVAVRPDALRDLADRIDAGRPGAPLYRPVACDHFLPSLLGEEADHHPATFPAGTSQLVAPTGSGKSVFMRLQALEAAERGIPVALVVPDIPTTWRETRRLEEAAAAAGCDIRIAPLSSPRGTPEHLVGGLADPDTTPEEEQWLMGRFGHACLLQAHATGHLPEWGEEPCHRLRQLRPGESRPGSAAVDCPFIDECDRFRPFRDALGADIVVTNHHAFLFGHSPRPLLDENGSRRRPTYRELVLRQAGLILVDEMDSLQGSLAGGQSDRQVLSSRPGRPSDFLELTSTMEASRPAPSESPGARQSFEALRRDLHTLTGEAETLAEAAGQDTLKWPAGRGITPKGEDGRLAAELFGDGTTLRLDRLFGPRDPDSGLPEDLDPLREHLHSLVRGLRETDEIGEDIARIHRFLIDHPPVRGRLPAEQIAHALVRRALLVRVDEAFGRLSSLLADPARTLPEEAEGALQRQFRGRAPWSVSPPGPLGTSLREYRLERQESGAVLECRNLAGDPHGEIAELGGLVSEALTGGPRAVLGLSATGRFPGSPSADLLIPLWAFLPDEERTVEVHSASVEVRISGRPTHERLRAVREATRGLWSRTLASHLAELERIPEEADRRRALLVTNSYQDAREAAAELRRLDTGQITVRHLDRSGEEEGSLTTATVETFGRVPEPAVLVAPFRAIARGLNITLPHAPERSALGSIFLLTRPVAIFHEPDRILCHLSYRARRSPARADRDPNAAIAAESRDAWKARNQFQRADPRFSRVPRDLRLEMVCDTLAELIQLAGRARRGGTPARLYLVDEAFEAGDTPEAGWQHLIRELLDRWQQNGELPRMEQLHGAVLHALATYADRPLETLRSDR